MRYLLFILLLSITFITKGQEVIDSSETVMLEVQVFDLESKLPISEASVKITNSLETSNEYITDSLGFLKIEVQKGHEFTIIASKMNYLLSKGDFSTIQEDEKTKSFFLEFHLQPACITKSEYNSKLFYKENDLIPFIKNTIESPFELISDILKENPTIVLELTAVRSKNEPKKISKKRAEKIINELVAEGIEKNRLVFKDGGIGENEKEEDNRYVVFRVIKTDYVSKGSKK